MHDTQDSLFFTDDAPDALKELNNFIIQSASEEHTSAKKLKELIEKALNSIQNPESSLYFILDETHEELLSRNLFTEDFDILTNNLLDNLNDADPILRVKHNLSDQWSVIEMMDGGGSLEPIAYFFSPNMADQFINYISTTELRS